MLVFFKERLVFLSVPKTGSTAYQNALAGRADMVVSGPPELKHAPLYRYNRFFRPMFAKVCDAEMELFAVMREPLSWLESWYRYRQRPFLRGQSGSTHGLSFDSFVEAYLEPDRPDYANVGSQSKFLEPRPNGLSVKYLFRYEEPNRLNGFLRDRLGVELQLQRQNMSPKVEVSLSPAVERKLRREHAREFELYESLA